jgi:hypothetical protein
MSTPLYPRPRIWLRATVVVLLVALAWVGTTPWYAKTVFCLAMLGLLGSFPRPRIDSTCYEKTWFICFVAVRPIRIPWEKCIQIETDLDERLDAASSFLLFGVRDMLLGWIIDWLLPWFGGEYKLWLRTGPHDRVLAWQGNGEWNFRQNVDVLEDASGLPVTRG